MDQPVLLVVACEPADSDELSAILWSHSPTAVAERDTGDGPALAAGFDRAQIPLVVDDLDHRFTFEIIEADDGWLDAWRAHAQAWTAGQRFIIVPPWIDIAAPAERDLVLRIDPGHSFGNGAHPTTQLALAALEDTIAIGDRVLDVGCGSGILSVAAAVLGAASVIAVDVDTAAVHATAANAARHGVHIDVRAGSLDAIEPRSGFDVIVVNMLLADLTPLLDDLLKRACRGGRLVLSGLLEADAEQVTVAASAAGLAVEHHWTLDEWTAVAFSAA